MIGKEPGIKDLAIVGKEPGVKDAVIVEKEPGIKDAAIVGKEPGIKDVVIVGKEHREIMTPDQLRKSYVGYMKRIGASQVPSASLLPENDPTTLFTGS